MATIKICLKDLETPINKAFDFVIWKKKQDWENKMLKPLKQFVHLWPQLKYLPLKMSTKWVSVRLQNRPPLLFRSIAHLTTALASSVTSLFLYWSCKHQHRDRFLRDQFSIEIVAFLALTKLKNINNSTVFYEVDHCALSKILKTRK